MLRERSRTPSVTSVRMASGSLMSPSRPSLCAEQTELLRAAGLLEMLGRQHRLVHVQTKLVAMLLEPAADHPCVRPAALHAHAEGGIVILAAAHVADQLHDMGGAIRVIRLKPFDEQIAHFEWQAQQHVSCAF